MSAPVRLLVRRDTAANWSSANPILLEGEMGYETDTGRLKIGGRNLPWNSLPYFAGSGDLNAGGNIDGGTPNSVYESADGGIDCGGVA